MNNKNCPFKILLWIGYAIGAAGVGYFLWIHQAHVMHSMFLIFFCLPALSCIFSAATEGMGIAHMVQKPQLTLAPCIPK